MRTVRVGVLALTLVAMSAPAPALAEVEPFAAPPDRAKLVEEEQRVWSAGDDLDRSIRRARNLYRDEALTGWLQSMLEPPFTAADIDPVSAYWLGEAYRLRGDVGDTERAASAYRNAIDRAPDLAAAWRGIGEVARRAGRRAEAIDAYRRYLDGAPDALDREAIRAELERLQSSNEQGNTQ